MAEISGYFSFLIVPFFIYAAAQTFINCGESLSVLLSEIWGLSDYSTILFDWANEKPAKLGTLPVSSTDPKAHGVTSLRILNK
jgi:hypothetical protein